VAAVSVISAVRALTVISAVSAVSAVALISAVTSLALITGRRAVASVSLGTTAGGGHNGGCETETCDGCDDDC
jgi:hypothetical protein